MKFRFPIVIIDEDYRSENASGFGIRALAAAIEAERLALRDMFRSGEINDHTLQALFSEITLSEALLNGRQARK